MRDMEELVDPKNSVFEQIRHIDENDIEYWSAREMAKVLEYSEYRHFLPVIEKAKEACANSNNDPLDHFEISSKWSVLDLGQNDLWNLSSYPVMPVI